MIESLRDADPDALAALAARGPLVRVYEDGVGKPTAAAALVRIARPVEQVWDCVQDMESLPAFIAMVESLRRLPATTDGQERVRVNLRFKIAIFSTRFHFVARVEREPMRRVELHFESGKVRDVNIRFELVAAGARETLLLCHVGFATASLGWLVNVFMRHHPEIEWGVHAGSALSVAQSVCALAARGPTGA